MFNQNIFNHEHVIRVQINNFFYIISAVFLILDRPDRQQKLWTIVHQN